MLGSRAALVPLFLLLGSAAFSAARAAESPRLLADVNRQPGVSRAVAHGFVPAGERLVFWTAGDTSDDTGLWSTDGTPQGTAWLPFVLCSDGCNITPVGNLHGNALLIIQTGAFESSESISLWRTDGTASRSSAPPAKSGPPTARRQEPGG